MSIETLWKEIFGNLVLFKYPEGHCEVLQKYNANLSLGIWVSAQRNEYKLKKEGEKIIPEWRKYGIVGGHRVYMSN